MKMSWKAFGAALVVGAGLTVMGAGTASASPGYPCPGGTFCAFDRNDGRGAIVWQLGSDECDVTYDIGNAGRGDRVTSYWNRTGKTVELYDWTGVRWEVLASIPNGARGNLPAHADNRTDAIRAFC